MLDWCVLVVLLNLEYSLACGSAGQNSPYSDLNSWMKVELCRSIKMWCNVMDFSWML